MATLIQSRPIADPTEPPASASLDHAVLKRRVSEAGLRPQPPWALAPVHPGHAPRPAHRPVTKFENRGIKLGHGVWDLVFTRRG